MKTALGCLGKPTMQPKWAVLHTNQTAASEGFNFHQS